LNSRVNCLRFSAMDHLHTPTYGLIGVSTNAGHSHTSVSLRLCVFA
jgi:hypothetical protein